jgi:flagellar basal-body rod protein FlgF
MSNGIYIGMSAASARMAQLDSIADNLANAETPGFIGTRPAFEQVTPANSPSDPQKRVSLVAAAPAGIDRRRGAAVDTGRPLDIYMENEGFLAVKTEDGRTALTRDGRIDVGADGTLTIGGRPVLDDNESPIVVPTDAAVRIEKNGKVVVDGQSTVTIGSFDLQGDADRVGSSLLIPRESANIQQVVPQVRSGAHEGSNAPALDSAVTMVTAQRMFENAMQAIQTSKQLDEKATEVGRVKA